MEKKILDYQSVVSDIKNIIYSGRTHAYKAANRAVVSTHWNIGKRIVEQAVW